MTNASGIMPTVGTVSGASIRIRMNDHEPPHLHVFHQGQRAKAEIATGNVLAPTGTPSRLPANVLSGTCRIG